jgi:hypothetical protein
MVWRLGNVNASVHEDMKWYCISVEQVIFYHHYHNFFIIISTLSLYYLNYILLMNGIYTGIVLGIVFVL